MGQRCSSTAMPAARSSLHWRLDEEIFDEDHEWNLLLRGEQYIARIVLEFE
jgi:hypothetical protein